MQHQYCPILLSHTGADRAFPSLGYSWAYDVPVLKSLSRVPKRPLVLIDPRGLTIAGDGLFSDADTYEVLADFAGGTEQQQPALRKGEHVKVARAVKEKNGWLWGMTTDGTAGFLPGKYLQVVASRSGHAGRQSDDLVWDECPGSDPIARFIGTMEGLGLEVGFTHQIGRAKKATMRSWYKSLQAFYKLSIRYYCLLESSCIRCAVC